MTKTQQTTRDAAIAKRFRELAELERKFNQDARDSVKPRNWADQQFKVGPL